MNTVVGRVFKFILTTKLFWGLAVLYATGVILSPVNNKGINIFLSPGNQADVLRQVSNNGIIAVGMTLVILTGGIDLSVGSMMALGSVICAMLLTQQGWSNASLFSIPILAVMCVLLCLYLIPMVAMNMPGAAHRSSEKPPTKIVAAGAVVGIILAALAVAWTIGQLEPKFGVLGVLITVPAVGFALGALNGVIIAKGRLQPFIVTLAMMVAILGLARLLAGQDAAVYPVYTGSNATEDFDVLRALVFNVVPVPGIFFLLAVFLFGFVLKVSTFRPVRLCHWRQRTSSATRRYPGRSCQDRGLRDLRDAGGFGRCSLHGTIPPGKARRRRRSRAGCHRSRGDWRD